MLDITQHPDPFHLYDFLDGIDAGLNLLRVLVESFDGEGGGFHGIFPQLRRQKRFDPRLHLGLGEGFALFEQLAPVQNPAHRNRVQRRHLGSYG